MQRLVADIQKEISTRTARSAWDKGVRAYAEELFDSFVENRHLSDDTRVGKITEVDLLGGATSWSQYSFGGCSLVYDGDICERLSTPNEAKRLRYGERKPGMYDTWLDAQAEALRQAARIVIRAVNRRD